MKKVFGLVFCYLAFLFAGISVVSFLCVLLFGHPSLPQYVLANMSKWGIVAVFAALSIAVYYSLKELFLPRLRQIVKSKRIALCVLIACSLMLSSVLFISAGGIATFPSDGIILSKNNRILQEVRADKVYLLMGKYEFVSFSVWKYDVQMPYKDLARGIVHKKAIIVLGLKPMDKDNFVYLLNEKKEVENSLFALVHRNMKENVNSTRFPVVIEIPEYSILSVYAEKIEVRRP